MRVRVLVLVRSEQIHQIPATNYYVVIIHYAHVVINIAIAKSQVCVSPPPEEMMRKISAMSTESVASAASTHQLPRYQL